MCVVDDLCRGFGSDEECGGDVFTCDYCGECEAEVSSTHDCDTGGVVVIDWIIEAFVAVVFVVDHLERCFGG